MPPLRTVLVVLMLLTGGLACSASDFKNRADREVYEIVEKRRAELFGGNGGGLKDFTVEAPPGLVRRDATETGPASRPAMRLTVVEALRIAAANSREYQSQKERVYLAALDLTLERFRLGFIPDAGANTTVQGVGEEATQASGNISASLSRILGSGASIVSNIGLGIFRSLLTSEGWRTFPTSLGLSITQPLLRGVGPLVVTEPLTQSERNVIYALRGFERFRQEFAVDVVSRVYRILQEEDIVFNELSNYNNLTRVRERNEAHNQAGRLSAVELDQAKQNELSARNRWIVARENLKQRVDELKVFFGVPVETDFALERQELIRLQEQGLAAIDVQEEAAFRIAGLSRHDYKTTLDRVVDAGRRVRIAANALEAGLDLFANYDVSSAEGRASDFDFKNATWNLGVNIDLPVNRLPERNAYRSTLIALEAERRAASLATDNLRLQIRNGLRDLRRTRESYEIQTRAVKLADGRVASTQLFLAAGRSSTRDVLESQEAQVAARNALTRALIEYTVARLTLIRDIGALDFDESGLRIDDELLAGAGAAG